jgi:hypothetical protein
MNRTDVTYGQLDKVLRGLGFTCRLLKEIPPARLYEHKESGALVLIPLFPDADFVLDYHLTEARTAAERFGLADPKAFDARLRKAA